MTVTYTPTTWVSGTTPLSAANMNNIETGISNTVTAVNAAMPLAGGTFTGAVTFQTTLSGALKDILIFTATDGKTFRLRLNTDNSIELRNGTDSKSMWRAAADGSSLTTNGNTIWTQANDGTGSGLDADLIDGLDSTALLQLTGTSGNKLYIQSTTPTSPAVGDLWVDTSVNLG